MEPILLQDGQIEIASATVLLMSQEDARALEDTAMMQFVYAQVRAKFSDLVQRARTVSLS